MAYTDPSQNTLPGRRYRISHPCNILPERANKQRLSLKAQFRPWRIQDSEPRRGLLVACYSIHCNFRCNAANTYLTYVMNDLNIQPWPSADPRCFISTRPLVVRAARLLSILVCSSTGTSAHFKFRPFQLEHSSCILGSWLMRLLGSPRS